MHPALARDLLQASELCQWIGVIVDAQVVERIVLPVVDQQRRRLPASLVAAGGLARPHRRNETPGERHRPLRLVDAGRLGKDRGPASMLPATENEPCSW